MRSVCIGICFLLLSILAVTGLIPSPVVAQEASPVSNTVLYAPDSDSHASGTGSGFPTGDFTLEGYVYLPSSSVTANDEVAVFSKKQFAELTVYMDKGYSPYLYIFEFSRYTSSTDYSFIRCWAYYYNVDSAWNHVAATYDSSADEMTVYVNGVALTPGWIGLGQYGSAPADTIKVGGLETIGSSLFDYSVDEVRVSSNVRYTTDFTRPSSPFSTDGSTVGLWHFDEAAGSTSFSDSSGSNITLTAANSATTVDYTPTITVTSPDGGEDWTAGTSQSVTWTSANIAGTVSIDLYKGGAFDSAIVAATTDDGSHSWTIPNGQTAGSDYTVVVTSDDNGTVTDSSDAHFTITAAPVTITVTSPNGGETWQAGRDYNVTWTSQNVSGTVTLELDKGGSLDSTIVTATTNDGSYNWTIPTDQTLGSDYSITVISDSDGSVYDSSDSDFSVVEYVPVITPFLQLLLLD